MYVHFSKPETSRIFETEIKAITNNITTMGIEELILHTAEQKGKAEGKAEVVRNLIIKLGLNDEQAADVAEVSVEFVQQVRAGINK
jgi:protein-disulfide isomerase-like protein with CxxC motif